MQEINLFSHRVVVDAERRALIASCQRVCDANIFCTAFDRRIDVDDVPWDNRDVRLDFVQSTGLENRCSVLRYIFNNENIHLKAEINYAYNVKPFILRCLLY